MNRQGIRTITVIALTSVLFAACVGQPQVVHRYGEPEQLQEAAPEAAPIGATFSVMPETGTYRVGEQFTVQLVLDSGSEMVNAVDVILRYDPQLLQVVDTAPDKDGTQVLLTEVFDQHAVNIVEGDTVKLAAGALSMYGIAGVNTIAEVTFQTLQPGPTFVNFTYYPPSHSDTDVMSAVSATDILGSVQSAMYNIVK